MVLTYFFALLLPCVNALLLDSQAPRNVTQVLTVNNADPWGTWHPPHYCASGTYAVAYDMKIEGHQGHGDDTSLNAVLLYCGSLEGGLFGGQIESGEGSWGSWVGKTQCPSNQFMTAFALQSESRQGDGDDTAANYVQFKCRSFFGGAEQTLVHSPGHGFWGTYGAWSQSCAPNSAVCGIQVQIESPQGHGDDTAFNNMKLFCCPEPNAGALVG